MFLGAFCSAMICVVVVRALQRQLAPKSQQHYVQSAVFVMMSLGDLTVNGIVHFFEKPIAHIRVIFLISAALYTVSTLTLLLAGPQKVNNVTTDTSSSHSFSDYFRGLPPELWRIGAPYALGFFTFYCFLPYASSWMGSSVLQGMLFSVRFSPYFVSCTSRKLTF